jgi:hypothetical protein
MYKDGDTAKIDASYPKLSSGLGNVKIAQVVC